jgi:hypothetical protein
MAEKQVVRRFEDMHLSFRPPEALSSQKTGGEKTAYATVPLDF